MAREEESVMTVGNWEWGIGNGEWGIGSYIVIYLYFFILNDLKSGCCGIQKYNFSTIALKIARSPRRPLQYRPFLAGKLS
jgi:hypothetical protein